MTWHNADGLLVKFGTEEAVVARGGELPWGGDDRIITFELDWEDALSATDTIIGAASSVDAGSPGILIPAGWTVWKTEMITSEAWTSSGTIGSSTLTLGLIRQDRSTTYDVDGFWTTSHVAGTWNSIGEVETLTLGGTGVGVLLGTELANSGYLVCANSAHASHPYTAGRSTVKLYCRKVVDNVDGS